MSYIFYMTKKLEVYPNRIRELREALGMTQESVGEQIGKSAVHVGHLELGRSELSLPMLRAFARVFGVSVADVLSEEDNPRGFHPRCEQLMNNWTKSGEAGRLAIERVAECMVELSEGR